MIWPNILLLYSPLCLFTFSFESQKGWNMSIMCLLQGEVYTASEIQKYSYFMNLVPVSHFPFPAQAGGAEEEDKEYQCFQFPPHSWHSPLALQLHITTTSDIYRKDNLSSNWGHKTISSIDMVSKHIIKGHSKFWFCEWHHVSRCLSTYYKQGTKEQSQC